MNIQYNNEAITRLNACKAQEQNVAVTHTNMWQIMRDQAKIPSKYAEDFDKIYKDMIGGRYSQGDGTLMKWIQERNPNFDNTLYVKLMDNIQIERTNFANQQKRMIDMAQQYNTFLKKKPAKWFISDENNVPYDYKEIRCSVTDEVMKTRIDDTELDI